jgi:putative endonuclease
MFLFSKKINSVGKNGENDAKKFLLNNKYDILALNYCNYLGRRIGEIDIIAKDQDEIVFIEVKSRTIRNTSQPLAEESINRSKLYKLNKIANFYIQKNKLWNKNFRFDAITVYYEQNNKVPIIKHIKNIYIDL